MKKNVYLAKAATMLKKNGHTTRFLDENILEVSTSKNAPAFAYLAIEKDQFPGIIVSFSYGFTETYIVADLIINLFYICPVALGEAFYQSSTRDLYWGEEAAFYFMLEHDNTLLEDIEPVSDHKH